jgi:23S rRNA pseudouridine955/2504/2580 synthase
LLDILFEDDTLLIINKPAGLPMHRTAEAGDDNLVAVAERVMANRDTPVKLRPVNRLDRGTSGAALLAKSATSAGMFGRFVKEVGLGKLYLAIVAGTPPAEGTVTEPLDGKDAETRFRTILQWPQKSLLAVAPITGRMHQIRRHLRLIGHPVLGDRRYGGAMLPGTTGHLLHAFRVSLEHPVSGREITVHAPLPVSFIMQLRALTDEEAAATLVSLRQLSI